MENLEIAYDHYKETFTYTKEAEKDRNKIFIIVALLITALYLFAIEPDSLYQVINDLITEQWQISVNVGFGTVQSLLWVILLFYSIRYFQINTYIERQYNYLHKLESDIANKVDFIFEREGRGYLDKYPLLLDMIYYIYTWAFPVIYILVVCYKIILEWINIFSIGNVLFNTIISVCIIVASILYLIMLHPNDNDDVSVE
jgi:hypothetical protein